MTLNNSGQLLDTSTAQLLALFIFSSGLGLKSLLHQLESLFNNLLLVPSTKRGVKDVESYKKSDDSAAATTETPTENDDDDLFSSADSLLSNQLNDSEER